MGIFEVCAGDISGNGIQPLHQFTPTLPTEEIMMRYDTDYGSEHLVILILDSLRYSLPKVIRSR